jgi:hypothetical protein
LLYSGEAYAWRRLLRPLGLDKLGRDMAQLECRVYHHVCVLPEEGWRSKLSDVGLTKFERIPYFATRLAQATSLYSGATRLPILRRLVEVATPITRALAKAESSEDEWVSSCRRVLDPFLAEHPSGEGCGQMILVEKREEASALPNERHSVRIDSTPSRPRVLWICKHRIARFEEVNALLRAGAEVVPITGELDEFPNAVRLPEEDDPLYPDWRSFCTIPNEVLAVLRAYDYNAASDSLTPALVSLLDRWIDVVWVGTFTPVAVSLLRRLQGGVVLRTYGGYPYTGSLGPWPVREEALRLLSSSDGYVFCPALPYQGLVEDSRLTRGETYWPACVTASRLGHVWKGESSEPFACETISLIERYRRQVYEQYVSDFGDLPLRIFGQNPVGGSHGDRRIVGTLADDAYNEAIASCRVVVYAGLGTKYHLHYHVLEALVMRVPVIFFETSALAHISLFSGLAREELRASGMCSSVMEARDLATRLLQSPREASVLSERQGAIRSIFEPSAWDGVVANLIARFQQRANYRERYADSSDHPPEAGLRALGAAAFSSAHRAGTAVLARLGSRKPG